MAFRDDRDALRAKSEALEGEVDDLREKLAEAEEALSAHASKDDEDESELGDLHAEVEALRRRLGVGDSSDANRKEPANVHLFVMIGMLLLFVVGVGLYMFSAQQKADVVPLDSTEPLAEPVAFPPVEPLPDPLPEPFELAIFGAVVVGSSDGSPEVGSGCVLVVELAANATVHEIRLECLELVYRAVTTGAVVIERAKESSVEVALRLDNWQRFVVSTPDHMMTYRRDAQSFVDFYVDEWSLATARPPFTEIPEDVEPAEADLALAQRLEAVERESSCDLNGAWIGAVVSESGRRETAMLLPANISVGTRDDLPVTHALNCEERTASINSPDRLSLTGRFGPAFATFLATGQLVDEPVTVWLRRTPTTETTTIETNFDSLPPELQDQVRRAIEEAL